MIDTIMKLSPKQKVMVIGLDGLSLEVLLPLIEKGELPTFAHCLQQGAYGTLKSVTNMSTGPTWASFATGCTPQSHGILHDFHHQARSYLLHPTHGADCQQPAFWSLAGEMGYTPIVLNVPQTYPAKATRGVMLAGIDAPNEWAAGFDSPPGMYRKLRRAGIDYIIDCGLASYMQNGQISAGIAAVARETEGRTQAAEFFMQQFDWDLLVVVYSLPDVWQHYYWSSLTMDPDSYGSDLIMAGYRLLDKQLARLLSHLPEDGILIICSDHGFGPLCGTRDTLNDWLAKKDWLNYEDDQSKAPSRRLISILLAQTRKRLSFRLRQQILRALPNFRQRVESELRVGRINWGSTQVYAAIDHQELWINLKGRQPLGWVDPENYEGLCAQISKELLSWKDEKNGVPIIRAVHKQPYANFHKSNVLPPDLFLEWNPEAATPDPNSIISGDHASQGTIIVSGRGIKAQKMPPCSLIDVAPLVLQALGLSIPDSMEGKIPYKLFANPLAQSQAR